MHLIACKTQNSGSLNDPRMYRYTTTDNSMKERIILYRSTAAYFVSVKLIMASEWCDNLNVSSAIDNVFLAFLSYPSYWGIVNSVVFAWLGNKGSSPACPSVTVPETCANTGIDCYKRCGHYHRHRRRRCSVLNNSKVASQLIPNHNFCKQWLAFCTCAF